MAAKVENLIPATKSQSDRASIASSCLCNNRQSEELLSTKRIHLGGLESNAVRLHDTKQAPDTPHASVSAQSSAGSQVLGKVGRLPTVPVKGVPGGMRAEDKTRSSHTQLTGTALLPARSQNKSRPGMSHSTSSPQLYSLQYHSDSVDPEEDCAIPPPCDARKHRHHSPPTICIGSAPSPTGSGSSSGGVLLSNVRERANRSNSYSSVARHETLNRPWPIKRDDRDDGSDEDTLPDSKSTEDSRRGFSLSEVDNRSVA
jgi:hypothetical protein